MVDSPRYQRMPVAFRFPVALEELARGWALRLREDQLAANANGSFAGECAADALALVAMAHFQIPNALPAGEWVNLGLDMALHYFWGEWGPADPKDGFDMRSARERRSKNTVWYRPFHCALIHGLLSERWDDVARLAEWPWASLMPEYSGMGGDLEDEVAQMYIIIAASLRTKKLRGVDKLIEKVRKCRAKRPRLLMKCWNAVLEKDQAEFDKAMAASLKHHATIQFDPRDGRIAERLALPQTAICLAAMRLGLEFPDLPEELSDWIITRNSIGLE